MPISPSLDAHLQTGTTTLCRCWQVTRRDGWQLAFTDHDGPVSFDAITFRAREGMSASAFEQTTGLAVNNSEASGVLTDDGIAEADIAAGRFDAAEVTAWLVNWAAPDDHFLLFRGQLGEISREGAAFRAELRGLTERLNQPLGSIYQKPCAAQLGDARCGFDLTQPGFAAERAVDAVDDARLFWLSGLDGFEDRWFEKGRLIVLTGAAAGALGAIKNDRAEGAARRVELWTALAPGVAVGDMVRVEAGCDKRAETCRLKFSNLANFRGFPHIPGEDWVTAFPAGSDSNDGGSMNA